MKSLKSTNGVCLNPFNSDNLITCNGTANSLPKSNHADVIEMSPQKTRCNWDMLIYIYKYNLIYKYTLVVNTAHVHIRLVRYGNGTQVLQTRQS